MTIGRLGVCLLATTSLLGGCIHNSTVANPGLAPVKTITALNETRVVMFRDLCPISKAGAESFAVAGAAVTVLSGVAGALIPALVNQGIVAIKEWMEARAKEYSTSYSARGADEFYKVSDNGTPPSRVACMAVVRGAFGPVQQNADGTVPTVLGFDENVLRLLGLARAPEFYMEANFAYSGEGTIFRVKPQVLFFGRTAAKRTRSCAASEHGCKTLNIALAFEQPVQSKDAPTAFGLAAFSFPEVPIGGYYPKNILQNEVVLGKNTKLTSGGTSQWITLPAAPAADKTKGSTAGAFSILATIGETEDDDDFLLKVAAAIGEKKDEIGKAISDPIVDAIGKALGKKPDAKS